MADRIEPGSTVAAKHGVTIPQLKAHIRAVEKRGRQVRALRGAAAANRYGTPRTVLRRQLPQRTPPGHEERRGRVMADLPASARALLERAGLDLDVFDTETQRIERETTTTDQEDAA